MLRLHRLALAISRAGAMAGGALLLAAAIVIGVDVLLRSAFSRSIGGADELSGYALAIATAWGLSFALLHRAHIRIDSLYGRFPAAVRAGLDIFSLLGFLLFAGLITWRAWGVLRQSISSDTHSISALSTPLAVPQALWLAGLVFLAVTLLLLLVASLAAAIRGDLRTVARLIGSKAVVEEVQEEIAAEAPRHGKRGRRP
jgi:TRAP-type C4-dicarboxylate transport system permease small subunit